MPVGDRTLSQGPSAESRRGDRRRDGESAKGSAHDLSGDARRIERIEDVLGLRQGLPARLPAGADVRGEVISQVGVEVVGVLGGKLQKRSGNVLLLASGAAGLEVLLEGAVSKPKDTLARLGIDPHVRGGLDEHGVDGHG